MNLIKNTLALFLIIILLLGCNSKPKESLQNSESKKVTCLPFFNSGDFTPEWIKKDTEVYKNIHKIPDFSFVNQEGETITQKKYKGKIYIADFFFTSCTGICRSLSLNMKLLQDTYENDSEVYLLSHSVTPDIDSVSVLKKYADVYGVNASTWDLVTGDKNAIYELARTAYFSDEGFVKTKKASEFIHTENFLLVDKRGRIRGVYNGTLKLSVKRLMRHIEMLKSEE